ncbi:MAG: YdbH domain-containing protein [Parvibaculum sp.]|nr:YdbH domain-containing protein [Parvibaculum sp.]
MQKSIKRRLALVFGLVLLVAAGGAAWLWTERLAVAEQAIARALSDRGVAPANFRVVFLGLRSIVLADIDIGEGDAVVDSVTVTYSAGELLSGRVRSIDVGKARLRVHLEEGGISFGALDPLLAGDAGGGPLLLPEIAAERVEIALSTPWGEALLSGPAELMPSGTAIAVSLPGMTIEETGSPRLAPIVAAGGVELNEGVFGFDLSLASAAADAEGTALGHVAGNYDTDGRAGNIRAEGAIAFARGGLRPQMLAPLLAPYHLDLTGVVAYRAEAEISPDGVLATADIDLDKFALHQTAAGSASFSGLVKVSKGFGGSTASPYRVGLSGLRIDDLTAPQRFAPVRVEGDVTFGAPVLDWRLVARSALPAIAGSRLGDLTGSYNADTQKGNFRAAGELGFAPGKVELQTLLPVLLGKVTRMSGNASYVADISISEGGIASSGEATLMNVGFVTPAASFEGIGGTVKLASLLPPRTRGPQTLRVRMLEAGLPLANGVVTFDMDRDGLRITDARWPFAGGQVVLVSRGADVLAADARFDLTVEHVDLEALLSIVEVPGLTATGQIGGTIPVVLRDGDPVLLDGALAAEDEGIIVYLGAGSDIAPGEETKLLTDALRNFHYTELTGGLSGNANGELVLRLGLRGSNPDLYSGYPFAINVKLEGSLADVLRRGTVGFRPMELIRDQSAPAVTPPADKTGP